MEHDALGCTCHTCRRTWIRWMHPAAHLLFTTPAHRQVATSPLQRAVRQREAHPAVLKVGDRVEVTAGLQGTVKFVGPLADTRLAPSLYVGVHLDDHVGSAHNGTHKGKRYFHCPRGHGALLKYCRVTKVTPPEARPPVHGNQMFPSYDHIRRARRGSTTSTSSRPPSVLQTSDQQDMAVRDRRRWEQRERRTRAREQRPSKPPQTALNRAYARIHQRLGADEKAVTLVTTVQKLCEAYQRGEEHLRAQQESAESAQDTASSCDSDRSAAWRDSLYTT